MKFSRRTLLALACTGALTSAGTAFAAGSATLFVTGTVAGTCQFANSSYQMLFGTLDPSTTANVVRTTTINYLCSNGTPASSFMVAGGNSPATVNLGGPGTLPVQMTWTTPTTPGSGFAPGTTPISFTLTGTILAADLNAAPAGFYINRVPLTLLP